MATDKLYWQDPFLATFEVEILDPLTVRYSWSEPMPTFLALLAAWQRNGYWDFSDGVYAETARALLHGQRLYRDVAAAQLDGHEPVQELGLLAQERGGPQHVGLRRRMHGPQRRGL